MANSTRIAYKVVSLGSFLVDAWGGQIGSLRANLLFGYFHPKLEPEIVNGNDEEKN